MGSGATVSVPASMLPASSRFATRPRMWLACPSMRRKNSSISARDASGASSTVPAEPLIEASGARSSWLTILRNSARWRSRSSNGARSCIVTMTEASFSSSPERIGVRLISVRTLRPSGTDSSTSSARIGAASSSRPASGSSPSPTSRPSGKRHVTTSSNCSGGESGVRISSTMRRASRFTDATRPLPASNTTTPTGEVSTSASSQPAPAPPRGACARSRSPRPPARRTAPGSPRPPA